MSMKRYGAIFFCTLIVVWGSPGDYALAEDFPSRSTLLATYRVDLAALNLGEFHLSAKFNGSEYELRAKGRFSLLAGIIYRASGVTRSTGKLTKAGPEPSSFRVSYQGGGKREQRRIDFANGTVSDVFILPPRKKKNPRRSVPVTKEQLEDVLDPLTAAFLSVRSDDAQTLRVCHQTLPVFDGKQRFDLVLTPKRVEHVDKNAPALFYGPVAVCQVKFVPIGGYRPDHPGIKFMAQTDDIEVWLVPLPESTLYVTYRIVVPTPLGQGSATLTKLES